VSLRIRTRLTLWYVALLAVILAALAVFLVVRLRADLVAGVDRSLDVRAEQISLGFRGAGEGEFQDVSDSAFAGLPRSESASQIVSAGGDVLESSGDPIARRLMLGRGDVGAALASEPVRATVSLGADGEPFRVLGLPAPGEPSSQVLVVATALETVDRSVERLVMLLLIAGPAALAAAGVGGWWVGRKALGPVARMTEQAAGIGIDRLDERVAVPRSTDELGQLARTFNAMLERLERDVQDKRRFVADASHELRTPLAVMRSELDVSLDADGLSSEEGEVLESVRDEVDRMSRIVERLLILARIDEGQLRLLRAPVGLGDVVEAVVRRLRPLADAKAITVTIEGDDPRVSADRERLVLAVETLVENAIKYTAPGGRVRISIERRADEAVVTVADEGPGMPAEAIPLIFERFYRLDAARTRSEGGSGLGLAICREIMQAHGGRVWAESNDGGGSSFFIALDARAALREDLAVL
jgi:heavy metal sensor kinase